MSKTKKVLSIILITLLILSTILTLCKKVGFCASSSSPSVYRSAPFPISQYNGYLSSTPDVFFNDSCINFLFTSLQNTGAFGVDSQYYSMVTITEPVTISGNSGFDVRVWFNNADFRHDPVFEPIGSISSGSFKYRLSGTFANCTITYNSSNDSYNFNYVSFSNFDYMDVVMPCSIQSDNSYGVVTYNTNIGNYPVWTRGHADIYDSNNDLAFDTSIGGSSSGDSPAFNHYFWKNYEDAIDDVDNNNNIWKPNYQNPSSQQNFWDNVIDFFNRSFKSLLGGISGATKTIGDYIHQFYDGTTEFWGRCIDTILGWLSGLKDDTEDISEDTSDISGSVSSIDSRLSSFFGSFWGNLDDHLEDFIQGIWGDLPDIMKAPYRIAQWFYQHGLNNGEFDFMTLFHYLFDFDSTVALNTFSNNKYGDFLLDVRDFFNTFFGSISDQTASSRVFFVIPIGSHFGSDVGDVEINFDWYSSIRDNYLPYFMAFLYISVIWLFFKRLPDILRGVAGAESSFTDSLPYDTEHTTYTQEGVYTSRSHVSNGGRNKVTYNYFNKM